MNSSFLKKALPHFIAVVVFLIVAMVYCKPALEGKTLSQTDVIGHTGMARQSELFNKQYGHYPLWTESLFSGMPTYNIALPSSSTFLNNLVYIIYLFPAGVGFNPIVLFFLASVCFYVLTQVLRINPWLGILSSIAYAYSTFDAIIIAVGHNTQMAAIGFMPLVVAGLLLITQKKWIPGAALLCVSLGWQAAITQHIQIVYYTLIILGLIGISFLIKAWREKTIREGFFAAGVAIVAGIIGLSTNAVAFIPLQEYAKETMRGGKSELAGDSNNKTKGGLDKDYAFNWSYGISETLTLFVPGAYGGGTIGRQFTDNSKLVDKLQEVGYPEEAAYQLVNQESYWGNQDASGNVRTAGPVYLGAVICFLFILGIIFVRSWHSWWIISATVLGIILAWGKNFSSINYFLFDHLPFYSKFRSPTMALVIPQLTFPLMAAMGLDEILKTKNQKEIVWKKFRTAVLWTAGLLVLAIIFYLVQDYKSPHDNQLREYFSSAVLQQMSRGKQPTPEMQQQAMELGNSVVKSLQSDRQSLMGSDLLRTFIFVALAVALVGLYLKDKINSIVLLAGLLILSSYDLLAEGKKYLGEDNFKDAVDIESVYTPTAADQKILDDANKPFRVFDLSDQNGPFNSARASYFFNSIGGYHPAKLGLYQDIIERQLTKQNMNVINMLNTRYFIQPNAATGQPQAILNPGAFGPCWLVKAIHYVNTADEEMKSLDSMNVRDTAIVRGSFQNVIKFIPVADSTASIKLVENLNDYLRYQFSSRTNQFAVFSEVYYDKGWDAYLDGKKTDYCKVDYILRGMPVPAGEHTIEFRFEPQSLKKGATISWIASSLGALLILYALLLWWRNQKKKA
ncbi:MAG TPA: YfhO family protein [Puia sp.]|nr:YfhO family protein [Puia sp.]